MWNGMKLENFSSSDRDPEDGVNDGQPIRLALFAL